VFRLCGSFVTIQLLSWIVCICVTLPHKTISWNLQWDICTTDVTGIFPGGAKSTFCLSFSGCSSCNAKGHSQNTLPFLHHKENAHVTATVTKMHFVGSSPFIHSCFFSNYIKQNGLLLWLEVNLWKFVVMLLLRDKINTNIRTIHSEVSQPALQAMEWIYWTASSSPLVPCLVIFH